MRRREFIAGLSGVAAWPTCKLRFGYTQALAEDVMKAIGAGFVVILAFAGAVRTVNKRS
jgi:hypothetical protein